MIILQVIVWVVAMFAPAEAVERLRATAPQDLDATSARDNFAAAHVAAFFWRQDADELLAVAWHESRYVSNVIAPEANGMHSCGVLTPYPRRSCEDLPLVGQYLDGAASYDEWFRAMPTRRAAWIGVAGGWPAIAACGRGEAWRACAFATWISKRAELIRGE